MPPEQWGRGAAVAGKPYSSVYVEYEPVATNDVKENFVEIDNTNAEEVHLTPVKWYNIFHPRSPSFRIVVLLLLSMLPFGGHFVKNGLTSVEQMMLDDDEFHISNTQFGTLLSALALPNLIVPFFAGDILDRKGHRGIIAFLALALLGQAILALGLMIRSYVLALFGALVFGVGEGSVVVGQRAFVALYFAGSDVTFALGFTVAIANVSKMLAKSMSAPAALYLGDYSGAAWLGAAICAISLLAGVLFTYFRGSWETEKDKVTLLGERGVQEAQEWVEKWDEERIRNCKNDAKKESLRNIGKSTLNRFSLGFWTVSLLHVCFINVFHLFYNVSSSFYVQKFGFTLKKAGYISSLSCVLVFFAPVVGLAVDRYGRRIPILFSTGVLAVVSYLMLLYTQVTPAASMLLMSLCMTFVPTVLISCVPAVVPCGLYGVAYGIMEVMDAAGAMVGNVVIGFARDISGSFTAGMYILLGLAVACIMLTAILAFLASTHQTYIDGALPADCGMEGGDCCDECKS